MDYSLNIDFSMYDIGKSYYRKNRKCIFDPIREILIVETPEEIIRQKFVKYLIYELYVPKSKIEIEVPMVYFKNGAKGRADIIVYGEDKDGINYPVILIECKAPNVPLVDEVWFQVARYDEIIKAQYIIITNGELTYAARWNDECQSHCYLESLLSYQQLISGGEFKFIEDTEEAWQRPKFNELLSAVTIQQFAELDWFGEDTDRNLYPFIFNFIGFLHDSREKCAPADIDGLNIGEDGHRYTSYGNAAGGSWPGDYRYFILEDKNGNNQIISIAVFGSIKCENDPTYGNRKGITYLIIAIDDFDKQHNSLQLNLDKYTIVNGNMYTIWHDGTLTAGKNGSVKRKEVIEYIKSQDETMVDSEGRIVLGYFDCSKEIQWSQESTKYFIKNLIRYALLRDEFRRIKQGDLS